MLQSNKCTYLNTLESNIYNTFSMMIELLKDEQEKFDLSRILRKYMTDKDKSSDLFIAFCNKTINIDKYKRKINKHILEIINLLFKKMFKKKFN